MNNIIQYIFEILGVNIQVNPIPKEYQGRFPMYITEIYKLHTTTLFNHELILAECKQTEDFSIMQTEKHFALIKNSVQKKVVLCMNEITSFNRKRLIEKGINFIIPGKQLFLPDLLLDLRESFNSPKIKKDNEKLQPVAQLLALHYILDKSDKQKIENLSFKELSNKFGYSSANSITNAVENLKYHEIIDVVGEKEKYIRFRGTKSETWHNVENRKLWANPVLKKVYIDELPQKPFLLYSNTSALPEYSNMNPSLQTYYAIEKFDFYALQKSNALLNANNFEGKYCLEVWNYNPLNLVEELYNDNSVVDPLSLYLSLRDNPDERIEMALEQIIEKYTW